MRVFQFIWNFYVFIQDPDELKARGGSITGIGGFMDANRGIRIYRDGFRVKPYGDPTGENDWLTLSLRRARNPAAISRPSWSVSYHQVVGAVFITRESNPTLIDQTNREGIVNGPGFKDLKLFADKVVRYFEGRAHADWMLKNPDRSEKRAKEKSSFDETEDALRKLLAKQRQEAKESDSDTDVDTLENALDTFSQAKSETKESEESLTREIAELTDERTLLTSLASLGVMTASFGHELVNDATEVLNHAARLRKHINDPQGSLFSAEERLEMLDGLLAGAKRIDAFAQFALDHVRPWKRRSNPVHLTEIIRKTLDVFDELLVDRYRATVTHTWPEDNDWHVAGWAAGWESVLVNLIANASWALLRQLAGDRKVHISVKSVGEEIVFIVEDSGLGIEDGTLEDIFRPGFSTKRDEHNRQVGTGMGLALVETFLKSINASITAEQHSSLGGAKFAIRARQLPVPK